MEWYHILVYYCTKYIIIINVCHNAYYHAATVLVMRVDNKKKKRVICIKFITIFIYLVTSTPIYVICITYSTVVNNSNNSVLFIKGSTPCLGIIFREISRA